MGVSVRLAYRQLLKALKKHVTSEPHFKDYLGTEFRKNANLPPADALNKLQLARDYASLITSVHYHSDLLQSYNIAVDRSEEDKRRIENTANRVGLQLPILFKDEEDEATG